MKKGVVFCEFNLLENEPEIVHNVYVHSKSVKQFAFESLHDDFGILSKLFVN